MFTVTERRGVSCAAIFFLAILIKKTWMLMSYFPKETKIPKMFDKLDSSFWLF
jgi:hypothetical protein